MNKTTKLVVLAMMLVLQASLAQESKDSNPEYTGENFSLEGALAIFKKSNSLEEFEKLINEENNNVNNLDLNDDGEIDYVSVESLKENDTHVIILRTYLSEKERQDIATIGIEKTGNEEALLQIEGDSDLYAANTIVEPSESTETIQKSKGGPNPLEIEPLRVVVNVWFWPSVRFLYAPGYVVWVSPYRWNYYPKWWRPWKPYHYTVFYGRAKPYRVYYHRTPTRRIVVARNVYAPRRSATTVVVHKNRKTVVVPARKSQKAKATRKARTAKRRS